MTEAIESKSKSKAVPTAFEMPKFELPNFEVPKMEIPAAFRELAEKSVSQAKETYEKMKSAAEEATDVLEDTYATATKGASDYGLKVIEAARANTNAAFDFATQIMTVSRSDSSKMTSAHALPLGSVNVWASSCDRPEMTASGWFISCAAPAAISPTEIIVLLRRISVCALCS